jgi:hypothetical protein
MTSRRTALTLALASTLALAVPAAAFADEDNRRTMTLSGTGTVYAAPDKAIITIGVRSEAKTAGEALADNNTNMQAVIDLLRANGLEERDIQTSQFSVDPQFTYDNDNRSNPPTLVGYVVTNNVAATIRDLDAIGTILDGAVNAGSNQIDNISFAISDSEPLEDEARRLAVADVIEKAELYATAASIELGPIQSISEGGGYQPVTQYRAAYAEAADLAVPIAAGQQAIEVQVSITWEIR